MNMTYESKKNKVVEMVDIINMKLKTKSTEKSADCFQEELEELGIDTRVCSKCNLLMIEGYVFQDGDEYYCSDECLNKDISEEEWMEMAKEEDSDCYFTEWI